MSKSKHVCNCSHASTLYDQSLLELEFERGIWQAAIDNDLSKIKQLLSKGWDINATDLSGYTALHYASRNKHGLCVQYLLEQGACVNCKTKSGKDTPLHRAAYIGDLGIVKSLVVHGACVEMQNDDGQTCLHKAIQNNHIDIAQYLLVHMPSLASIRDNKNKTAKEYCNNMNISNVFSK